MFIEMLLSDSTVLCKMLLYNIIRKALRFLQSLIMIHSIVFPLHMLELYFYILCGKTASNLPPFLII
jgi:hypothetical protein